MVNRQIRPNSRARSIIGACHPNYKRPYKVDKDSDHPARITVIDVKIAAASIKVIVSAV